MENRNCFQENDRREAEIVQPPLAASIYRDLVICLLNFELKCETNVRLRDESNCWLRRRGLSDSLFFPICCPQRTVQSSRHVTMGGHLFWRSLLKIMHLHFHEIFLNNCHAIRKNISQKKPNALKYKCTFRKNATPLCACPLATLVIKVLLAAWTAWFTSSSRSNVVWSFVVIYYSLDVVHALPVVYIDSSA